MSEDPEALRRRLYRPGAEAADLAAFLAARPAAAEPVAPPAPPSTLPAAPPAAVRTDPAPPAVARRRSPRLILPATVLLAGAAAATAWGLGGAAEVPSPTATPLPTASVPPSVRAAFVRSLVEGRDAGLRDWLAPTGVRAQEGAGSGPGTVVIAPPAGPAGPGRLTVYLVLESDAQAGWAPARLVIHDDRTIHLDAARRIDGTLLAGIPAVAASRYDADERPIRVIVQAPKGVRWGLAAVFGA